VALRWRTFAIWKAFSGSENREVGAEYRSTNTILNAATRSSKKTPIAVATFVSDKGNGEKLPARVHER